MKNSSARGQVLPKLEFTPSVLPIPAAHDRAPLTGVEVGCLAPYRPFPSGRKAAILRRQHDFADTVKDPM